MGGTAGFRHYIILSVLPLHCVPHYLLHAQKIKGVAIRGHEFNSPLLLTRGLRISSFLFSSHLPMLALNYGKTRLVTG